MNVGYIGLGALGSELAKCFLKSHELHVWDINPVSSRKFAALGARVAPTAADLGRSCDVVMLCLPRSSNVHEVLFGSAGLSESLTAGKLIVDQTSGVPHETRAMAAQLARQGVGMMDAAVSASPHVVSTGGATLMASGADDVFRRARPLLEEITTTIVRCGSSVGDGQAMKMVNNAMNAGCRLGTLELVALGRKAGLSLASMTDALSQGSGRNLTTDKMLPAIGRGEASTNFALALMLKDVNQAVQLGMATGVPMPLTRTVRDLLQLGLNTMGHDSRLEDMVGFIERMAATRMVDTGSADAQPPAALLRSLDQSLWAVCRAISEECVAAGLQYGLSLDTMAVVLGRASGWSVALHGMTSAMQGKSAPSGTALGTVAASLQQITELGIQSNAPVLIANIAGSLFDRAVQEQGSEASVDVGITLAAIPCAVP